ncbi:MAG: AhpC/TSA family protein [Proteobacteria bacterium]|nr:AhpC/TSA family protein [Pseudomonadota bacterium]
MSDITPLVPRLPVAALAVALAGGGRFDISAEKPQRFTLVVFFRGLHCPICRTQLRDLEAARAERTKADWGLSALRVGYGLDLRTARAWGLYVSSGRGKTSAGVEEPALFSEPGLFLVRPDRTLYFASVQSMPFARPHLADILGALDFVIAKDYPARGEVASLAQAAE